MRTIICAICFLKKLILGLVSLISLTSSLLFQGVLISSVFVIVLSCIVAAVIAWPLFVLGTPLSVVFALIIFPLGAATFLISYGLTVGLNTFSSVTGQRSFEWVRALTHNKDMFNLIDKVLDA